MTATTTAETPLQRVLEIIEREARARFGDALVGEVEAMEDEDDDGWQFLVVRVLITDPDQIDQDRLVGFVRKLREALERDANETRFPVVTYDAAVPGPEVMPDPR